MDKFFRSFDGDIPKIDGQIKGTIPSWVNGSLYFNGPALYQIGDSTMNHLLDGLAAIQRWNIADGKVTYQRKLVQTESLRKNLKANTVVVSEFGTFAYPDPCKNIFQRFFSLFKVQLSDNTSVTVWPKGEQIFASTDTDVAHKIDTETLDTIESMRLPDNLSITMATAHKHWDPDGTVHGLGFKFVTVKPKYTIYTLPSGPDSIDDFSQVKAIASIPVRWPLHPSYVHTFCLTDNYYILAEQPVTLDLPVFATMNFTGTTAAEGFKWYPDEKTIYHIIRKTTGEKVNPQIVYYSDAHLTFHHINAYEESGFIIMDLCAYDNIDAIRKLYLKNMEDCKTAKDIQMKYEIASSVRRFVFPLLVGDDTPMNQNLVTIPGCKAKAMKTSKNKIFCQHDVILNKEKSLELPMIHYPKYNGRKYKYVYGVGGFLQNITKINMDTKEYIIWNEKGDNYLVSEPVFLPSPNGHDEDDGIILSAVTSIEAQTKPFLVVLDAKNLQELARVHFDITKFSMTFHSLFRPG